jgi:AbrB family looped-hinge helix DNA binding protein
MTTQQLLDKKSINTSYTLFLPMVILREEMKIGPKGQVVIPKAIRKIKGFVPGSKVVFEFKDNKVVIRKSRSDEVLNVFREIARSGPSVRIDPNKAYDEMMEERMKKVMKHVRR